MLRNIPGCSGMFQVPGFLNAQNYLHQSVIAHSFKSKLQYFLRIELKLFTLRAATRAETGLRVATVSGLYISETMFSPELNLQVLRNIVGDCSEKQPFLTTCISSTQNIFLDSVTTLVKMLLQIVTVLVTQIHLLGLLGILRIGQSYHGPPVNSSEFLVPTLPGNFYIIYYIWVF